MSEEIPKLTSVNTEMNPRATEIRLVLGDSHGRTSKFKIEPLQLNEIAEELIQMTMDASVAKLLGRQSALAPDANGSAPAVGSVIGIAGAGTEDGAVVVDLKLDDGRILRLAFGPAEAEHMRRFFSDDSLMPTWTN
jgi:hypothetical protein